MFDVNQLKGCIVAHVTPLTKEKNIDVEGLKRLTNHIVTGGASAILINGSTAEFARLLENERYLVAKIICEANCGKIESFINISDTSVKRVFKNIDAVKDLPYSCNVLAMPFYYSTNNVAEQLAYMKAVYNYSDKPLIIYNIPSNVNYNIDLEVVREVSKWERVVGIKDSGASNEYLQELMTMQVEGQFHVILGREFSCAAGYRMGAKGCVSSLANAYPRLFVDQYQAAKAGDFAQVDEIQAILDSINKYNSSYPSPMLIIFLRKRLLKRLGICEDYVSEPFEGIAPELEEAYLADLEKLIKTVNKRYCR